MLGRILFCILNCWQCWACCAWPFSGRQARALLFAEAQSLRLWRFSCSGSMSSELEAQQLWPYQASCSASAWDARLDQGSSL